MKAFFQNFKSTILVAAILLSVIFSGAFLSVSFSQRQETSAEMVYCPLTKKLQPVKPSKEIFRKNPFDEICASDDAKLLFSLEISAQTNFKFMSPDAQNFENLIFDYFQKGKSVFDNVPNLPNFPNKNLTKNFSSFAGFGSNYQKQFVWKLSGENFSFAQNPRPPNEIKTVSFGILLTYNLDKISRKIAPRAPPFLG